MEQEDYKENLLEIDPKASLSFDIICHYEQIVRDCPTISSQWLSAIRYLEDKHIGLLWQRWHETGDERVREAYEKATKLINNME